MNRALIYHADSEILEKLRPFMEEHGWEIDSCGGMLEMLRLIQEIDYDIVALSSDRMNVELSTIMGTIRKLREKSRIILNLAGPVDSLVIANLTGDGTIIRGKMTPEKFLAAAGGKHLKETG